MHILECSALQRRTFDCDLTKTHPIFRKTLIPAHLNIKILLKVLINRLSSDETKLNITIGTGLGQSASKHRCHCKVFMQLSHPSTAERLCN